MVDIFAAQAAGVSSATDVGLHPRARQDVGKIIAYRDFEATTAFDHRGYCGYTRSGLFTPDVDPVFSANCDGPHRILGEVVAKFSSGYSRNRISRFQMPGYSCMPGRRRSWAAPS